MVKRNPSLGEDVVQRCLANGRKLKATVNKMVEVAVIQWEREDPRELGREFGRELFYLSAIINPQTDIDNKGYVNSSVV